MRDDARRRLPFNAMPYFLAGFHGAPDGGRVLLDAASILLLEYGRPSGADMLPAYKRMPQQQRQVYQYHISLAGAGLAAIASFARNAARQLDEASHTKTHAKLGRGARYFRLPRVSAAAWPTHARPRMHGSAGHD